MTIDSKAVHPSRRVPHNARLTTRLILVVFASFVCGASAELVFFFAHPFSPSFWRHFGEFWGFLWLWERGTLCACVWATFVAAALLVRRLPLAHIAVPGLALAGSMAGFLTSAIVRLLAQVLGSSPFIWLGFGALLGIALNVTLISWLGSRSNDVGSIEG